MSRELVEELRDMFEYHEDGFLIRRSTNRPCGQHATCKGYAHVWVNGRYLYAHRIIYAIVRGEMPGGQIDHIDGNPMNNLIENLRDVSGSKNQHNSKKRKDNSSGFPGVGWHTQTRKWRARIRVDGQNIYLGLFEEFDDAVQARKLAKIRYHPTSPEAFEYALELFPCGGV